MRFFCGKNRGAISVFLTLILVPVLIFSGIIVDISRLYAAKTVISGAGDLTMNAALARYDKQLKDSYGLITMADDPSSPSMKTYLEQSFLESCNASALKDTKSTDLHSMIQLELGTEGVEVQGVKNSSLADTQVLQQQILEYMKFRAPVYMVSDILEKFKKMPLKNMNEKKDYIEAKTDYAKKAKELGKPSENAKTAVDAHSAAIQGVQGMASEISEAMNILVQQSVFYLAAESLQKYLDNEALAPVGSGQISSAVIRQNLAGAIVWDWSETVFDEIRYADLVAAVSLLQNSGIVVQAMKNDESFTQDEWNAYVNIDTVIQQSIANLKSIYEDAEKDYINKIENYKSELQTMINTGNEGITQLQKLEDVWVNKVQPAEKACQERKDTLQSKGEDISELNELEEEENIKINTDDLEDMLNCLERNTEEAEGLLEEAEKMIQVTDHIKAAQINSTEACSIFERGAAAAVNTFWDDNANFGMPLQGNYYYTDPKECNFYKEYLSKVGTKSEDETEQNAKDQKKQDAEDAQGEYDQILEGLNALGKEKNLKDFSGLSYPDEFPSGQNKIGSDIQSAQTVKKLNLDSDDTTVNDGAGSLSAITELLKGLDNLSGELLERAYLMEYMSEMFNCMTTKENDVSLSNDKLNSHYIYNGEIEYLLYGNESTIVNKTEATAVLYSLRLAINSAYVFFDKTLNAEANSIASGISAATGQAWLYPIIKYSYLFCCAVVYSGQDLSSLMKGDEVAVWRANDKVKLNYKEYLKLFLLVSMISENNEKKLLVRTADCIQLNTGKSLSSKYTMLTFRADVKAETTFLPKVPALLGRSNSDEESQKTIKYQGILGY